MSWVFTFNIDPMGLTIGLIVVATALIMSRLFIYFFEHENLVTEKRVAIVMYIFGSILLGLWAIMEFRIDLSKVPMDLLSNLEDSKTLAMVGAELCFASPLISHYLLKSQWFQKWSGLKFTSSELKGEEKK